MVALLRIGGVAVVLALVLLAGMWLGDVTAPRAPVSLNPPSASVARTPNAVQRISAPTVGQSIYFHVGLNRRPQWEIVEQELQSAFEAGVTQYIFTVPLFSPAAVEIDALDRVLSIPAMASEGIEILLDLDLNPNTAWLESHPDSASLSPEGTPNVSAASTEWAVLVHEHLAKLLDNLDANHAHIRVRGFILSALDSGRWRPFFGEDLSTANSEAFRGWLRTKYADDVETFRSAWGMAEADFETTAIPRSAGWSEDTPVFYLLPEDAAHIDYAEYRTAITVRRLTEFSDALKEREKSALVFAPYGYTFDFSDSGDGHLGLSSILDSSIDGLIAPVSYIDRGLGGAGGPMGAIDSAALRGKQWIQLDDTHTGMSRASESEASTVHSIPIDDVVNVYRRNFSLALLHGAASVWSDPRGKGNVSDENLWNALEELVALRVPAKTPEAALGASLAVVVDEKSLRYQRRGDFTGELLVGARDAALRSGVTTRFVLLEDLLEDRAEDSSAYLFLNAFVLTEDERRILHERFARNAAAAIWLYAPGYISPNDRSVEGISATTKITIKMLEGEPPPPRSTFAISGNWVTSGTQFGSQTRFAPVFAIEDADADVIANYAGTATASVAVKFMGDSWTSIYVAEPSLTVPLLRELFDISGIPILPRSSGPLLDDLIQYRGDLLMIHARKPGRRTLDLGASFRVQDLLDNNVGWPRKRLLSLRMNTGDTHLFQLTRSVSGTAVDAPSALR